MPDEQESLEERTAKLDELLRERALNSLQPGLAKQIINDSPEPMIIIKQGRIVYANKATSEKWGYGLQQIATFNDLTLETGEQKKRLEEVLNTCAQIGWDELDLSLKIPTLDRQELRLDVSFKYVEPDIWVAYINKSVKVDPKSIKHRAKIWASTLLQKVFQKDIRYYRAPKEVRDEFSMTLVRNIAENHTNGLDFNYVVDLKNAKTINACAIEILQKIIACGPAKGCVSIVNADKHYRLLVDCCIPRDVIYCRNPTPNVSAAPI